MGQENEIELDVGDAQDVEIEVMESDRDDDSYEDQFSKAETSTQKRISRLTKKMRESERREQEAIRYAQAVQGESNSLKQRLNNLDTSYVTEYTTRVNTQISQAEANLTRAIELGDSRATVEAQRALTSLASSRIALIKRRCSLIDSDNRLPLHSSIKPVSLCLHSSLRGRTLKQKRGPCVTVGLAQTKQ